MVYLPSKDSSTVVWNENKQTKKPRNEKDIPVNTIFIAAENHNNWDIKRNALYIHTYI